MKKKIALTMLILSAGLTFTACGLTNDSENTSSEHRASDEHNISASPDVPETTDAAPSAETTDGDTSGAGGNPDIAKYIEITVSEGKYFHENHEISYDDLIMMLDELPKNTTVKISDENATLKAYENLTKALEERGIMFEAAS